MMKHVELCPICHGKGTIVDPYTKGATVNAEKTCHGCNGKGWVEVGEDHHIPIYMRPDFIIYEPRQRPFWQEWYSIYSI